MKTFYVGIVVSLLLMVRCAAAADISVGALCISNVTVVQRNDDQAISNDATWARSTFSYRASRSAARKAKFFLFEKPVPLPAAPPDCERQIKKAKELGIGLRLAGNLVRLSASLRVRTNTGGSSLWVDPDGWLRATMSPTFINVSVGGGGLVNFSGHCLRIKNASPLLLTPTATEGVIEISGRHGQIDGAIVRMPGDLSGKATLLAKGSPNLSLRLALEKKEALIWTGNLYASDMRFTGPKWRTPLAELQSATIRIKQLALAVQSGSPRLEATGVSGQSDGLISQWGGTKFVGKNVELSLRSIAGHVAQTREGIEVLPEDVTLTGLKTAVGDLIVYSGRSLMVKGVAKASFNRVSDKRLDGTIEWVGPNVTNLPLTLPAGRVRSMSLAFAGTLKEPTLEGRADVSEFGVSGLVFTQPLQLHFRPQTAGGAIDLPIDIEAPKISGEFYVSDYDQEMLIKATLDKLSLHAVLHIDLQDLVNKSELRIPAGGLVVSTSAAISLKPWLAGTKPGFGKSTVLVGNDQQVIVRHTSPLGSFNFEPTLMTISEPIMRIGENGSESRAAVNLNATGMARFVYPLEKRKFVLYSAHFDMHDFELRMLDAGATIDIGGTIVSEPRIKLKNFKIDLDRDHDIRLIQAVELEISGDSFKRERNKPSDTAFQGKQKSPFKIQSANAVPEFNETSITVREIQAIQVSLALSDATLTLGDTFTLEKANVAVAADEIRSKSELESDGKGGSVWKRHEYMVNISANADGKIVTSEFANRVQLDVPPTADIALKASGRSDKLSGTGSVQIGAFSGLYQDHLAFGFVCKDGSHPTIPTESRFTTGGTLGRLTVTVSDGKFLVTGPLLGFDVTLKSDTARECDGKSEKIVLVPEQEWWTWGICPTWSNPVRKCKWSTIVPEIAIHYHFRFGAYGLFAHGNIAVPILVRHDGKTTVCYIPPIIFAPLTIALGITPQLEFSGAHPGDVEKILNGLVHAASVAVETGIVNTITNGAGIALSSVASDPNVAGALCLLVAKPN